LITIPEKTPSRLQVPQKKKKKGKHRVRRHRQKKKRHWRMRQKGTLDRGPNRWTGGGRKPADPKPQIRKEKRRKPPFGKTAAWASGQLERRKKGRRRPLKATCNGGRKKERVTLNRLGFRLEGEKELHPYYLMPAMKKRGEDDIFRGEKQQDSGRSKHESFLRQRRKKGKKKESTP